MRCILESGKAKADSIWTMSNDRLKTECGMKYWEYTDSTGNLRTGFFNLGIRKVAQGTNRLAISGGAPSGIMVVTSTPN